MARKKYKLQHKKNERTSDFEKDFHKFTKNAIYVKTIEDMRNRLNKKFVKKDENEEKIRKQTKLINGTHKSFTQYDS